MAIKKESSIDTLSFNLPSGVPVEIQEVTGAAEKLLLDKKEMTINEQHMEEL